MSLAETRFTKFSGRDRQVRRPAVPKTRFQAFLAKAMVRCERGWPIALALSLLISPAFGFLALRMVARALLHAVLAGTLLAGIAMLSYVDAALPGEWYVWPVYMLTVNLAGSLHLLSTPPKPQRKDAGHWLTAPAASLLLALALAAGIVALLAAGPVMRVDGLAMAPTINPGALVLVNPASAPERGDIVLYAGQDPDGARVNRLSRIIGVPGDTVAMAGGIPVVNGAALARHTLASCGEADVPADDGRCFLETLPDGAQYAILKRDADGTGAFDNRPAYPVPEDHYFLIGDNRDVARDSRDQKHIGLPARTDILAVITPLRMSAAGKTRLRIWADELTGNYEVLRASILGARPAPEKPAGCGPFGRQDIVPWHKCSTPVGD